MTLFRKARCLRFLLLLSTLTLFSCLESGPDAPSKKHQPSDGEDFEAHVLNLDLVDQDGATVKFQSDVLGDKAAVVIPFYTSCTSSYPILVYMLARLQSQLSDQLGKDVVFAALTADPATDNPARLKAYARQHKASPGWLFLTGDPSNLTRVLLGMGALFSPKLSGHNHIPVVLVGSQKKGWKRFHGFPSPDCIKAQIDRLLGKEQETGDRRQETGGGKIEWGRCG